MECGALWLDEVTCQLEAGHLGEHWAKVKIEYPNGIDGRAQVSWMSFCKTVDNQEE